jgi:hypothetical protein
LLAASGGEFIFADEPFRHFDYLSTISRESFQHLIKFPVHGIPLMMVLLFIEQPYTRNDGMEGERSADNFTRELS